MSLKREGPPETTTWGADRIGAFRNASKVPAHDPEAERALVAARTDRCARLAAEVLATVPEGEHPHPADVVRRVIGLDRLAAEGEAFDCSAEAIRLIVSSKVGVALTDRQRTQPRRRP